MKEKKFRIICFLVAFSFFFIITVPYSNAELCRYLYQDIILDTSANNGFSLRFYIDSYYDYDLDSGSYNTGEIVSARVRPDEISKFYNFKINRYSGNIPDFSISVSYEYEACLPDNCQEKQTCSGTMNYVFSSDERPCFDCIGTFNAKAEGSCSVTGGHSLEFSGQWMSISDSNKVIITGNPLAKLWISTPFGSEVWETIVLDGHKSESCTFRISKYIWDLGDGKREESERSVLSHKYENPGIYTITLTVVDSQGSTNSVSKQIRISGKSDRPKCVPVYLTGSSEDHIDVIFLADESYGPDLEENIAHGDGSISSFTDDAWSKANSFSDIVKDDQRGSLNFYYYSENENVHSKSFQFPQSVYSDCPQSDVIVLLHPDDYTDSTWRNIMTAEGHYSKAFLHEFGHAAFGLADQYDDKECRTDYFLPDPYPNIWKTGAICENDAVSTGLWAQSDCHQFTSCQEGWFKSSSFTDNIMMSGLKTDRFDEASKLRVNWVFDKTQKAERPQGHYGIGFESEGVPKSLVIEFNLKGNVLTKLNEKVTDYFSPNHLPNRWPIIIRAKDSQGAVLEEYSIQDPRIVLVEEGEGEPTEALLDDVDFTVVFPYYPNLESIEIFDVDKPDIYLETEVMASIADFCSENPEDLDCKSMQSAFKRGYLNGDENLDIGDAIFILEYIFANGPKPECLDSADVNDDGAVDIGDAVYLLAYLFASGPEPPAPFFSKGVDTTGDSLGCEA